jgi:serine/threonine protein kinase
LDVLKQCLEVNPKKRPTMEEIADHPWLNKNIYVIPEKKSQTVKLEIVQEEVKKEKPKAKVAPSKSAYAGSKPSPNLSKVAPKVFKK